MILAGFAVYLLRSIGVYLTRTDAVEKRKSLMMSLASVSTLWVGYVKNVKINFLETEMQLISIGGKITIKGKEARVTNITQTHVHAVDESGKTHKVTLKEAETLVG